MFKKTDLTLKDVVTAALVGAGAFAAAMLLKKKMSHSDPPIIISDGSLSAVSDNYWESPSHHVHALKPKGPVFNPGAPVGTVEFDYDGTSADLTPGSGEELDIRIHYGTSQAHYDVIHVTTNTAHRHLTILADSGTFDGFGFSRQLDEPGHILSVSAPGKGPYTPTTTGSELKIYFD